MATKNTAKTIPSTLKKLRDVQLDISAPEFKDAAEFKAAYDDTNRAVKYAAEASVDRQAELIAALAKMRALLSQRSSERIRKQAGVTQGWTQFFAWFHKTYKLNICLRTVNYKIDMLGGKKLCPSCRKPNGHTPSCPKYKKPAPQLSMKDCRLLAALNAGHDLVKAIEHGGNVQEAIREYKKSAPMPVRLDEWVGRQVIPYQPEPGDVVTVNGHEFAVVQVHGVSSQNGSHMLTIAVEPVRRAEAAPASCAAACENIAPSQVVPSQTRQISGRQHARLPLLDAAAFDPHGHRRMVGPQPRRPSGTSPKMIRFRPEVDSSALGRASCCQTNGRVPGT